MTDYIIYILVRFVHLSLSDKLFCFLTYNSKGIFCSDRKRSFGDTILSRNLIFDIPTAYEKYRRKKNGSLMADTFISAILLTWRKRSNYHIQRWKTNSQGLCPTGIIICRRQEFTIKFIENLCGLQF
jgi:hypothetical protein